MFYLNTTAFYISFVKRYICILLSHEINEVCNYLVLAKIYRPLLGRKSVLYDMMIDQKTVLIVKGLNLIRNLPKSLI